MTTNQAQVETAHLALFHAAENMLRESEKDASADLAELVKLTSSTQPLVSQKAISLIAFVSKVREDSLSVMNPLVPTLITFSSRPEASVRRMAIESLSTISPKMPDEALNAVARAVSDKNQEVANSAAFGLMMNASKDKRASSALSRELLPDKLAATRKQLISIFVRARFMGADAAKYLGPPLTDTDPEIVKAALESIDLLGKKVITPLLPAIRKISESADDDGIKVTAERIVAKAVAQ